jgi:predicted transcriptional regulator
MTGSGISVTFFPAPNPHGINGGQELQNSMKPKPRGRLDYMASTLRAAADGKTKTQIMYSAFLSYSQATLWLRFLVRKKLLNHDKEMGVYRRTKTGALLLRFYDGIAYQSEIASIMEMPPGAVRGATKIDALVTAMVSRQTLPKINSIQRILSASTNASKGNSNGISEGTG